MPEHGFDGARFAPGVASTAPLSAPQVPATYISRFAPQSSEIVSRMAENERSLAMFVDFENLALGFQGSRERFEIGRVLKRLVEKGKIVAKKAYADWNRYSSFTEALHEAAIELIEIPRRGQSGKNSADIRLCVDAMDLAYSKDHIQTFVVVSGDSDFSPLVSKLKELGKHVIGLGTQGSTSNLLRDNCDEFIYYEDLDKVTDDGVIVDPALPEARSKALSLLMESLLALRRENKTVLFSSMVKDTMKRKRPSFNETYHGYRTFSALLEDAQGQGLIELDTDERSGTYVVTRFGEELKKPRTTSSSSSDRPRRRRRPRPLGEVGERSSGERSSGERSGGERTTGERAPVERSASSDRNESSSSADRPRRRPESTSRPAPLREERFYDPDE